MLNTASTSSAAHFAPILVDTGACAPAQLLFNVRLYTRVGGHGKFLLDPAAHADLKAWLALPWAHEVIVFGCMLIRLSTVWLLPCTLL